MKLALVQMRLEPGSRSANLTAALKWVDEAADLTPSPDLICLPGCADHGGSLAKAAPPTDSRGGAFCETLAMKARDLGLFIATGHADADFGAVHLAVSLFDSDGDAILRQRAVRPTPAGETGHANCIQVADTILGRVGLLTGTDATDACLPKAMARMGADLLVIAAIDGPNGDYSGLARECKVWIVATRPASPDEDAGDPSAVYSPSGACVAAAADCEETMLIVDITIPTPKAVAAR